MTSVRAISVRLATLLAASACASSAPPPPDQSAALVGQGRALFEDHCALCHGETGQGDGAFAPALMTPAADLTHIAARRDGEFPAGEIARFIDGRIPVEAHRSPEMPLWGRVISTDVADPGLREEVTRGKFSALVAYLRSIQVSD
jgi:mono/diheme cytochrome c family protein